MRSLKKILTGLFCCFLFSAGISTLAQVRLPQLVSDGMVLQRDSKVGIWGWAAPGEKVLVTFTGNKYKVSAAKNGKWLIKIGPLKPGGPYSMDIAASNHIRLNNILVGDVWFCAGQSNMVLQMERVKEKYPEEIANANYPQIHYFFVPTVSDVGKLHDDLPKGKWVAAEPENVLGFGAVAYFFAQQLYNKYHVPVGIINSSVGGTPIQAWISEDGLKQIPDYAARVVQFKDTAYLNSLTKPDAFTQNKKTTELDKGLTGPKTWFDTTYTPVQWHPFWLPGYWADQGIKGLNGVVWFRKEINLPVGVAGEPAKLYMGRIVDADFLYINGVLCGSTTYQYPPRRYNIPAGVLKPGKNIIVIRIINTTGKGGFVPQKPYYLNLANENIDLRGDWQYKVGQAFEPANANTLPPFSAQNEPTSLYNTMVSPLINYTIKGIVWYQGETNANKPSEYRQLLPALINNWRNKFRQGELPFLYVQLPNFMETQYLPSESQWAELRDAQLSALSIPHTAMVVTIDAGEWNDIHPLNKKLVGNRLALAAENMAYGDKEIISSGPIYQSATVNGNKIEITFTNTGSGLIAKGETELQQFAIAGENKKFIWANAVIKGDKVIVFNDTVPNPRYVRYAWADNPDGANLYNKEDLPASPFKTDDK